MFTEKYLAKAENCTLPPPPPPPPPPSYSVGVLPELGSACTGETITIRMDDEDDDQNNKRYGWMGSIGDYNNTHMTFCKVNGSLFKNLTYSGTDYNRHYAVLQLSNSCPPGSRSFSRYFDNEDDNNRNAYSGNIYPNTSHTNTTLNFCLFEGGSSPASGLPNLGFEYGVFAPSDFVYASSGWSRGKGFIYTDDEDDNNENSYSGASISSLRIISHGTNTTMNMAKVKGVSRGLTIPSERVFDKNWMESVIQIGNGMLRGFTVVSNWSRVFPFEGTVVLVLADSAGNPMWITSPHTWEANMTGFYENTQQRQAWDEIIPQHILNRISKAAVIHFKSKFTTYSIGFNYDNESVMPHNWSSGWDSGSWTNFFDTWKRNLGWLNIGSDSTSHVPDNAGLALIQNREIIGGWSDPVFSRYINTSPDWDALQKRASYLLRLQYGLQTRAKGLFE